MSKRKTLTDIPDSEIKQVVKDFESEGCVVKKTRQYNGKWTVIAECPYDNKPLPRTSR